MYDAPRVLRRAGVCMSPSDCFNIMQTIFNFFRKTALFSLFFHISFKCSYCFGAVVGVAMHVSEKHQQSLKL